MSVRGTSRLSRSRHFQDCRVFAHRVGKIPLRRMRENLRVCPLPSSAVFYCTYSKTLKDGEQTLLTLGQRGFKNRTENSILKCKMTL